jgi:hypothetical protein
VEAPADSSRPDGTRTSDLSAGQFKWERRTG